MKLKDFFIFGFLATLILFAITENNIYIGLNGFFIGGLMALMVLMSKDEGY